MLNPFVQGVLLCMHPASVSIACKAGSECIAVVARSPRSRLALLTSSNNLGRDLYCSSTGSSTSSRTSSSTPADKQTSSTSSSGDMAVDITRHNFKDSLAAFREALDKCSFYALDCEMTGLFTDGNKHDFLDDMQARYTKMADSSKSYIITQYGLSCFEATGPNSYQARTFNFYLFPQPHGAYNRRFLCDASSLAFLAEHGFDFNKCISQGVPYMPVRTRDFQLLQVNRSSEPRGGGPVVVTTVNDKVFVADLIQLVTDWLAGSMPSSSNMVPLGSLPGTSEAGADSVSDEEHTGTSANGSDPAAEAAALQQQQHAELALPMLNSYQRLLAYQELSKPQFGVEGHPGFWVKKLPDSRYIVLIRAAAQQAEQYEAEAKAARIAAIHDAAGFAAVFDLMRRSGKPAVGHNCMFDIAYGLYSFADAYLPSTWRDYKKMVNAWHPGGIFDTKYIAKLLPEVFNKDTSLATVYTHLMHNEEADGIQELLEAAPEAAGSPVQLPSISHAPGYAKYQSLAPGEAAHEAGYDAFMTGAAFARLLPLVAGKIVADPDSELAVAYHAAQEADAAAAAESSSRQPSPLLPAPSPLLQPPLQQNGQVHHAELLNPNLDSLHYIRGVVGRLNMTFTDMAYAALRESDPIPKRPYTYHLSGLSPGYRADEAWKMLQKLGLGQVRITQLDSSSCLAEFQPEFAPLVIPILAASNAGIVAVTWADYAQIRFTDRIPEHILAAADMPTKGVKRARFDETDRTTQQQDSRQVSDVDADSAKSLEDKEPAAAQSRCTVM